MNQPAQKQIEVQIMAQPYLLACPPEGEAAFREAVAKVDQAMCRIRDAGKIKARDRIAVLAALNIAFELHQNEPAAVHGAAAGPSAGNEGLELPPGEALHASRLQGLIERLDQALSQDQRPSLAP